MTLVSNYPKNILEPLLATTLNDNWLDLFDKVITEAKKPLFMISEIPFREKKLVSKIV